MITSHRSHNHGMPQIFLNEAVGDHYQLYLQEFNHRNGVWVYAPRNFAHAVPDNWMLA